MKYSPALPVRSSAARVLSAAALFTAAAAIHSLPAAPLTWAPPELTNPTTITVTNTTDRSLTLTAGQDYIIKLPQKITASGGVSINGGRNVVLIGGEIDIPYQGAYVNDSAFGRKRRALYVQNWSGTFHIEGLWIHGDDLAEGIDVDTRTVGATLQVQNVRVDNVHSRPEEIAANWSGTHHPDIIQNWGGPTYYRIDRLTGSSDYQGFMMQPTQFGNPTALCDFRRIDLSASNPNAGGAYQFFKAGTINAFKLIDVWLNPRAAQAWRGGAYPESEPAWDAINVGVPPSGSFVAAGVAGLTYSSPGYRSEAEMIPTAAATDPVTLFYETPASDGVGEKLEATQTGDYITYNIPIQQTGTYSINVRVKKANLRGKFQLAIDGANQGAVQDLYSNVTGSAAYQVLALGTRTFTTTGTKQFKFTVTGKNASSTGYTLAFDYIEVSR